jgi:hypothetical protein
VAGSPDSAIPRISLASWWFLIFPIGCAGIAWMALHDVHLVILGFLDVGYINGFFQALALSGWWLVFCLWLVAVIDLAVRLVSIQRGKAFVSLPGNFGLPAIVLPWLVIVGVVTGLVAGHLFW